MTQHWTALPSYNNAMLVVIIGSAFVERSLFLGGSSKTQPCLMPHVNLGQEGTSKLRAGESLLCVFPLGS